MNSNFVHGHGLYGFLWQPEIKSFRDLTIRTRRFLPRHLQPQPFIHISLRVCTVLVSEADVDLGDVRVVAHPEVAGGVLVRVVEEQPGVVGGNLALPALRYFG